LLLCFLIDASQNLPLLFIEFYHGSAVEMNISASRNDSSDTAILNIWYEESLSLINSGNASVRNSVTLASEEDWKPCLGILNLNLKGEQLWSYGDTQICWNFVSEHCLSDFPSDTVTVEVFQGGLVLLSTVRSSIRLVSIDHSSAMEILRDVVPDIELSKAELRLLLQILSGSSLKEAAQIDNVTYETKRSQFKSLATRTGFRTQNEVIRNSLLVLSNHVMDSVRTSQVDKTEKSNDAQAFLELYYKGKFRFHKISVGGGEGLRVVETGPLSGDPVVFIHSQTLPHPNQFETDWLERNNVRLIIPLRSGFLDGSASAKSTVDQLLCSTDDLANTIELFCGGKAKIVAHSTGVAYAVQFATSRPEMLQELVLCAAAYLGEYDNRLIEKLVHGFISLAGRSNLILDKSYDRYIGKMSTLRGLRDVLYSAYKKSSSDMDIFNAILSHPLGHSWMFESYRLSRWSVINDVLMGSQDVWKSASDIKIPVLFLHGASDPINAVEDARKIQTQFKNSEFIQLTDEGQSLFLNRFEEIISGSSKDWRQ